MSDPSPVVRAVTYERDEHRCVSCGTIGPLQYQHRRAKGMGGRVAAARLEEGVTSCGICNPGYEGHLQALALAMGWKVRSWVVEQRRASDVPVFYAWEGRWCRLTVEGERKPILRSEAMRMMRDVYGDEYVEPKGRAA